MIKITLLFPIFLLIYNSSFVVCIDRAKICFKNITLKRKENIIMKILLQKKGKAPLEINGLVKGLLYTNNFIVHLHVFLYDLGFR